ncbi:MAG: hypothetical protein OEW11_08095 [Nitrospirota bacterium]|nr:hypothetical protein [Nitrospirota bacterium]
MFALVYTTIVATVSGAILLRAGVVRPARRRDPGTGNATAGAARKAA